MNRRMVGCTARCCQHGFVTNDAERPPTTAPPRRSRIRNWWQRRKQRRQGGPTEAPRNSEQRTNEPRSRPQHDDAPRGKARIDDRADDVTIVYEPKHDGHADPGEVVWVWVPYEDDPSQGKDRPALVIGEAGNELVLIALTTKHHGKPSELIAIGSGSWDPARRPSYAKIEHLLRAHPSAIRREGATIDRQRFQHVVDGASRLHPFQAR